MIALALVPIDKVGECFVNLLDDQLEFNEDKAQLVTKFADYVCDTYIENCKLRIYNINL